MAFAMNDLIQEACEDLNLTGIGEAVEGKLAASAEGCVNRAIAQLNGDGYVSMTQQARDVTAAGNIYFRVLEPGEEKPNTVNMLPPDSVDTLSRQIGPRFMRLRPSNRDEIDRLRTYSYPTHWTYGTETEIAPSGETREVGIIRTNGSYPTQFRVYLNSQLPKYKLGDTIYLSSLYRNLLLYTTEMKLVELAKLKSYEDQVQRNLNGAMKLIDTRHANNSPDTPDGGPETSYLDGYYNVIGGNGF